MLLASPLSHGRAKKPCDRMISTMVAPACGRGRCAAGAGGGAGAYPGAAPIAAPPYVVGSTSRPSTCRRSPIGCASPASRATMHGMPGKGRANGRAEGASARRNPVYRPDTCQTRYLSLFCRATGVAAGAQRSCGTRMTPYNTSRRCLCRVPALGGVSVAFLPAVARVSAC